MADPNEVMIVIEKGTPGVYAPNGIKITIHNYDVPDDWDGPCKTDEEGDKYCEWIWEDGTWTHDPP